MSARSPRERIVARRRELDAPASFQNGPASTLDRMTTGLERPSGAALWPYHLAFFASGIAGLAYQIVWVRMFALGLGHELPSTLAIVSAFFAGLALGSWTMDRRLARAVHPARSFAVLEVSIAAWAGVTALFIPALCDRMVTWIGIAPDPLRHWAIAFLVPFLALLPATFAMGASLPAIDRVVAPLSRSHRRIGGLYASNTLGAVLGVLATTFLFVPEVGYRATILLLVPLNLTSAAIVSVLRERVPRESSRLSSSEAESRRGTRLRLALFVTGLLGIGYEIVAVRLLSETTRNTVYSFAVALAVYLLGTGSGGALYQRLSQRAGSERMTATLFGGLCASTALGMLALVWTDELYHRIREVLPGQFIGNVLAESSIAALVFLVPTLFMGATFSHLVQEARSNRGGVPP
jgi:spermidine synthase